MNEDLDGNRKLFSKEVSKAKGQKEDSCSRIEDVHRRLAQGKDDISVDRVGRVIGGLIDNEKGGFRAGGRLCRQIFTLKQIGEKLNKKLVCM